MSPLRHVSIKATRLRPIRIPHATVDPEAEAGRPVVAMVTDAIHPYHRGGKELRYHELSRRLAKDVDVHVYTMQWWQGPATRREDGVTYHAICPALPLYRGGRRSIVQALVFAVATFRLLVARFDVIEVDHIPFFPIFPLKLVCLVRRRRMVATWHEVWGPGYWIEYLGAAGRLAALIERLAMRLPDTIIAASPETAARLRSELGETRDIRVAPNGIDMQLVDDSERAMSTTELTTVGRQLAHKRLDLLLDAVAALRRRGRHVTCRIIGDGPEHQNLTEQARRLGIEDLIDFRRDVATQRDVYSLLKASTVFVFPSEREGFGIAALEAMACGLRVITTSAPDNLSRFLVSRSPRNIVCEPLCDTIADCIDQMLSVAPATPANSDPATAWIAEYDWDHQAGAVRHALLGERPLDAQSVGTRPSSPRVRTDG